MEESQAHNLPGSFDLASIESLYGTLPANINVLGVIGKGSSGVILHAKERIMERDVAIKILNSSAGENAVQLERFAREFKVLSRLDHNNIVKVFSSGFTEKRHPFHAMELLEGKTLAELLRENSKGMLPAPLFFEIFIQVLEGLDYAHSAHIVHRDLKPSNIMICQQDSRTVCAKLIDFGTAASGESTVLRNQQSSLTPSGCLVGTPLYMSPEQCAGTQAQSKSDVYSLACVMYQCLAGETPFSGENNTDLMYKHMHDSVPHLATEPQLSLLIQDCLEKSAEDRPTAADACSRLKRIREESTGKLPQYGLRKSKTRLVGVFTLIAAPVLVISAILAFFPDLKTSQSLLNSEKKARFSLQSETYLRSIDRLLSRFDAEKSVELKKNIADNLYKTILKMMEFHRNNQEAGPKQQKELTEKTLVIWKRALSAYESLGADADSHAIANLNLDLAISYRQGKHFKEARHYQDIATAEAQQGGFDLPIFLSEQVKLETAIHDMPSADAAVDRFLKEWDRSIEQGQFSVNDEKAGALMIIDALLSEAKSDTAEQAEQALRISNKITRFLLKRNSSLSLRAAAGGIKLLSARPLHQPVSRNLARETYTTASQAARLAHDDATALSYKRLADQQ